MGKLTEQQLNDLGFMRQEMDLCNENANNLREQADIQEAAGEKIESKIRETTGCDCFANRLICNGHTG